MVAYSRLMGENEPATVRTLTEYRQIFFDYVEKFRGRIVNAPGDSILAEFGSVVDAYSVRNMSRFFSASSRTTRNLENTARLWAAGET